MPRLLNNSFRRDIFYVSFISTYIERDVRSSLGEGNEPKLIRCLSSHRRTM